MFTITAGHQPTTTAILKEHLMYTSPTFDTAVTPRPATVMKASKVQEQRRFCPSMFCFTDEVVVRRVSPHAQVWLLTDEIDDRSWMMMGSEPTCPHCGTALLSVDA
jgi:ribosomal protein S27AE